MIGSYSGPIGAVITPLLVGINRAKDLCQGEPLCGACKKACPIDIDLPRMLLALRAKLANGDPKWEVARASRMEKIMFQIWSLLIQNRKLYDLALKAGVLFQKFLPAQNNMITQMPFGFKGWTQSRNLIPFAKKNFITMWKNKKNNQDVFQKAGKYGL